MPLPVMLAWTAAAVGAAALARVLSKEWQRVNATLHAQKHAPAETVMREKLPTLRRDPRTGVYRPD
jgi:hypothetical protein